MIADDLNTDMPEGWTVTAVILRNDAWEVTASDDIGNHVMTTANDIEYALQSAITAIDMTPASTALL